MLETKEPADRGEAFSILKKADLIGTGKWFNGVIAGYQKKTGIELEKSEKSKQRADKQKALRWAHNANVAEVTAMIATEGGEGSKFWAAWQLRREGKWPEISIDRAFRPHFKEVEVDATALAAAIKTLNTVKPATRSEAYNALKNGDAKVDARVYTATVASYEETTKTTLSKDAHTLEKEAINAKAHAMSAEGCERAY